MGGDRLRLSTRIESGVCQPSSMSISYFNHMNKELTARFREIRDKVEADQRLSLDDGIFLYDPAVPLQAVGELANFVRERKNGNVGYFNINTHLNPTNVCVYRCRFCAFRSDLRDPKGLSLIHI